MSNPHSSDPAYIDEDDHDPAGHAMIEVPASQQTSNPPETTSHQFLGGAQQQNPPQPAHNNNSGALYYYPPAYNGGAAADQNIYAQPGHPSTPPNGQGGVAPVGPFVAAAAADFRFGLFDCFDDLTSVPEVYLCSYCQVASQCNRIENGVPDVHWGFCCVVCCLDVLSDGMALRLGNLYVRGVIRKRYQIGYESNGCSDCCVSFFCTPCAIVQQYREMTSRGEWPGGILVNAPLTIPPQPQQQMGIGGGPLTYQHLPLRRILTTTTTQHERQNPQVEYATQHERQNPQEEFATQHLPRFPTSQHEEQNPQIEYTT